MDLELVFSRQRVRRSRVTDTRLELEMAAATTSGTDSRRPRGLIWVVLCAVAPRGMDTAHPFCIGFSDHLWGYYRVLYCVSEQKTAV